VSDLALADLIGSGPLLLDFDGPVCSIFAGYAASRIAGELVALLDSNRVAVTPEIRRERDPLAVLRWTATACDPYIVAAAEIALCEAELRAVVSATPTPSSHELIVRARACGLPVAVVSNNSEPAIRAYLEAHGLASYLAPIIGRPHAEPSRMKPDPGPVIAAAHALNAKPSDCTLIGDSLTDIEAARAAGVNVIGYANRPWKVEAFAVADAVVTSMDQIADLFLPARPVSPEARA
jgi:beta-phosphoglucomutase-like phosphatase (HAD superfamily)